MQLKNRTASLLSKVGFNINEINATIRSWEYASLSEKYSHGFDRITWLMEMVNQHKVIPNRLLKISTKGLFTHIDGNKSLGYLAAENAVGHAIDAADHFGVGIATISGCYPTGCMGQYVETIAKSGQIGIAISHSSPRVAAYGTVDKIFGTMGHSFGFPSQEIPYIYDSSVGAITNGDIMLHHSTNTPLPKDSVFTKKGDSTINPSEVLDEQGIFNGIIAIAGGQQAHKMSGFAGSLELLTRLAIIGAKKKSDAYSFFMVLNPSSFGDPKIYKSMVTQLEKNIIKARKLKDINKIYFSGQKSYLLRQKNSTKKTLVISNRTYQFLFSNNENAI